MNKLLPTDGIPEYVMETEWEHVILLSADALRADHLSCYGYHRETSPEIDALAEESMVFEHAHSVSSHTREAVPALLTGKYPDEAVDGNYHLREPSIASTLSEGGFVTAAFHSNPFVSRAYGFDRGFETFDDDLHLGQHKLLALAQRALDKLRGRNYARADEINDRALSWIDSLDRDDSFFLWNHYMDTHGPYEPPGPYDDVYAGSHNDRDVRSLYQRAIDEPDSITTEERETLIDLYDGEIRYLDNYIGEFLNELQSRDLLERSLVVFTADHGDAFGEHGYYEHPRYLDEELTHVPLLIQTPGERTETVSTPVSTLDIVATIETCLGLNQGGDGASLFGSMDVNRTVFMQARGVNDYESIRRYAARSIGDMCSCEWNRDSELIKFEECTDRALQSRLEDYVISRTRNVQGRETDAEDNVNTEVSRRLDALGYK